MIGGGSVPSGIVGGLVGLVAEVVGLVAEVVVVVLADGVVGLRRFGSGEVGSEGGLCFLEGGGGGFVVVDIAWLGAGLVVGRGGRVVGLQG